ncbi:hypothetical protein CUJ88_20155 [Paraburkholderia hospita]|uniref:Uncharacterized protein n=1 Tax=Paraburkholderia hospita TaxID=169430 RepID=A0AAN1MMC3_9BURK|nr:hypothetical protein C2L64_30010 [Paraburkholderia hospita]AXF00837.1 hypothetical protein CUJ88_20155 [Paraburkholderia hospita]OUL70706.1 hypothetical protein CA601_46905 [Paraburkholderia hospita]OUL75565.1 hypothetical protein CA602_35815 [Paraburkholderia hospita]
MLVNYGARHRKGLPISNSIAESAVKQVVSYRIAGCSCAGVQKRQRSLLVDGWIDFRVHTLCQTDTPALLSTICLTSGIAIVA